MKNDFTNLLPNQEKIEKRFAFISDGVLHANVVIAFRYIIFLINLEGYNKLPGPILYSLYKDLIVQTATIIESCIHYTLQSHIDNGIINESELLGEEWIEEKNIVLHAYDDGTKRVCGVVQRKKVHELSNHTHFLELNRACKKAGIFTELSFSAAEKLRTSRNKIHLAGLKEIDILYSKAEVDVHFNYANIVLNRLELRLAER